MRKIDWQSCASSSHIDDNKALQRFAKKQYDLVGRELVSLEIGALHGASSALLAELGIVFAVDLWGDFFDGEGEYNNIGQVDANFSPFIQNIVRLKLIGRVFPIVSTSEVLDYMPRMQFDFIYIDGGHLYETVKKDIDRSIRHLRNTGFLVFHDYSHDAVPGLPPGPTMAVDELLAEGNFEVVEHYGFVICLKGK